MELKEKRKWLVLGLVLILVIPGLTLAIMQETGSAVVKTGAVSAGDRITYASGFNGTTTEFATITQTANNVTLKWAAGFIPTYVVVAMGNPRYDVQGLLNTSDLYQVDTVSVGGTNVTDVSLASAYAVVGVLNNGTNMAVKSSHAPSQIAINQTLYDNSTGASSMGKMISYNYFDIFATPFTDQQAYILNLHAGKTTSTSVLSIVLTSTMSGTGQNLLTEFEVGMFVSALSGIAILLWAFPRRH